MNVTYVPASTKRHVKTDHATPAFPLNEVVVGSLRALGTWFPA
jgi:hypothetical protein